MKTIKNPENYYQKHVFYCTNTRNSDCCAAKGSEELQIYAKKKCKDLDLSSIRINKSGCLGRCKLGKVLVIYPEGIWYHYENQEDIDKIIQKHLIENEIVEELLLYNDKFSL